VNYDETDIAERYDAARHIPDRAMRVWFDAIKSRIPPNEIRQILDVGCGTGRFSTRLAQEFNADVIGVDPAETMLARARTNTTDPRVTFLIGVAESLPVSAESVCLAYLSMVYHHLCDLRHAFLEFNRILRDGGFLCIRNSTLDLLDKVPYLKYFPSALSYNRTRLPAQRDVIDTGQQSGFSLVNHAVISQEFATSMEEYSAKISKRALSDLAALPDAEFSAGIQRMSEALRQGSESLPIIEPIDLFVFRKATRLTANLSLNPDASPAAPTTRL
jgi:ubiquinone/menaquinone biosynthesis C-methylase UbiE